MTGNYDERMRPRYRSDRHRRGSSKRRRQAPFIEGPIPNKRQPFACPYCPKRYINAELLRDHITKSHPGRSDT